MKKSIMGLVFMAMFFVTFAALAGCFPGITGKVEVRADTKDFAGALASPSVGLTKKDVADVLKEALPTATKREKSLRRLVDGILETTGTGDGLFGGLSASGSVRALVRNQAIDKSGKLVLWMTAEASSGAYEFQQNPEDVTESSYASRNGVEEKTFVRDVTGTASPAVIIDLAGKLFRLDPSQNVLGLSSFRLIGGWYPKQDELTATARRVAWGEKIALLYLSGPGGDKGWYHWYYPKEPPVNNLDWGGMSTRFVDDPPESVVYVPATGSTTVAWFSITTSTGKQVLVDEKFALAAR